MIITRLNYVIVDYLLERFYRTWSAHVSYCVSWHWQYWSIVSFCLWYFKYSGTLWALYWTLYNTRRSVDIVYGYYAMSIVCKNNTGEHQTSENPFLKLPTINPKSSAFRIFFFVWDLPSRLYFFLSQSGPCRAVPGPGTKAIPGPSTHSQIVFKVNIYSII